MFNHFHSLKYQLVETIVATEIFVVRNFMSGNIADNQQEQSI